MNLIYALFDPRSGQLRYVGKATNTKKRLKEHLCDQRSSPRASWIQSLVKSGLSPEIDVIESVDDSAPWESAEQFWISYFRSIGCPLLNMTSGGRGGSALSEETKRKISRSRTGIASSDATCAKISASKSGHGPMPAEHRKAISDSLKDLPKTTSHCENIRRSRLGTKRGLLTRLKLSEIARRQWTKKKGT